MKTLTRHGLGTLALVLAASAAWAQGVLIPDPWPPGPRPAPVPSAATLAPSRVRIAAEVSERAARVHLDQTFRNPYHEPLEGTFVVALPAGAVVSEFAFHMNGKRVPGELLDAGKAREVYESIVRRARDPALLEWADRSLVRVRIFPIPPRGDGRVELVYAQVLPSDQGLAELSLPLRVPASGERPRADAALVVELTSERPLGPVYSPSHQVEVVRRGAKQARVSFEDGDSRLDRDFLLAFAPAEKGVGVELLSFRPGGEDGYFLLLLAPEAASGAGAEERAAKDVVFVLDTSGSMRQEDKLGKAVRALRFGLQGLDPRDRFGLVTFATEARPWRDKLTGAGKAEVAEVVRHLEGIEATGGTAIGEALEAGFALFGPETREPRPRYLVFLTDGLPTVGETDAGRLGALVGRDGGEPRLFSFGVGYDVNAPLLDELARRGRGRSSYVKPEEDLEVKVSSFFARLNRPVLTDLKLRIQGVETRELYPRDLPDLFGGDDLVVAGRYQGAGSGTVGLTGRLRGSEWSTSRKVRFPERSDDKPHLAVIWAERKVGYLLEQIRLHGESPELRDEVVRLAKRHGLVTPYTSYLVVEDEPQVARGGGPRPTAVPRRMGGGRRDREPGAFTDGPGGAAPVAPEPERAPAQVMSFDAAAGTAASLHTSEALDELKEKRAAGEGHGVRMVRGKRFVLRDGVWVDEAYQATGKQKEERVEAFSERYFELLRRHPELGECFALGERVVVVVGGVAYRVEPARSGP